MSAGELQSVATLAGATATKEAATQALREAEERLHVLDKRLADGETAAIEASRARAMGEAVAIAPTLNELADWRLEKAGLESAIDGLLSSESRASRAVEQAQYRLKAETHSRLATEARSAALSAYHAAAEQLRSAFVEMMAVDGLINERFPDPSRRYPPNYGSAEEIFGPGAVLMAGLIKHNWPEFPYATRPSWAPKNGNQRVFQHPDVARTQARLLSELGL